MSQPTDHVFAGSIPETYDRYLVPLIFEPYAQDLAARVEAERPRQVLELAAGTGVVTRALATRLPPEVALVASDLNPGMLEQARRIGTARAVEWRQADAMALPCPEASFDVVACQFGAMFFPDKRAAFAEARRVLRPGGAFLFNVWDRIEDNELADVITEALAQRFPADPPRFMARTPHGYHDRATLEADVRAAGFTHLQLATVTDRSRAPSPREPAVAYCQGTPLRSEIDARDPSALAEATDLAEAALARRFGTGAIDAKVQAVVVTARR